MIEVLMLSCITVGMVIGYAWPGRARHPIDRLLLPVIAFCTVAITILMYIVVKVAT